MKKSTPSEEAPNYGEEGKEEGTADEKPAERRDPREK